MEGTRSMKLNSLYKNENTNINFFFFIFSTDERITENILKAMQTLAALAGHLELQVPRDAFITAICRASLPPNYNLTILSTGFFKDSKNDYIIIYIIRCSNSFLIWFGFYYV